MMKYIKFLRDMEDSDTNFSVKEGDILPINGYGEDEVMGKFYTVVVNGQKYYYPEKFKEGCFEIIRKEDYIMEEKNYCLYIHTNIINNKVYIGITNNIKNRWRNNGIGYKPSKNRNQNLPFWNAIQKYGWDNFKHEILLENLSEEEAKAKEVEYIKLYKSRNRIYGYNVAEGGNGGKIYTIHPKGMLGKHHTKEHCEKQSNRLKNKEINCMTNGKVIWGKTHNHPKGMLGKTHSDEYKRKLSETQMGKKMSEESKIKLSNALKGRIVSDDTKQKLKEINIGKKLSEETKRKIGLAKLGNKYSLGFKHSNETKKLWSEQRKGNKYSLGYKHTEESKQKMSENRKGIGFSDEHKQKISQALKGRVFTEEHKEKLRKPKSKDFKEQSRLLRIEEGLTKHIIQIDVNTNIIISQFLSIKEAERQTNINASGIIRVCKRKQKTAGGYKWMYYEDYIKQNEEILKVS